MCLIHRDKNNEKTHLVTPILAALALCSLPYAAFAQDTSDSLSADELKERFDAQKTRGLDLSVPSEIGAFVKVFTNESFNTPIFFATGAADLIPDEGDQFTVICEDLTMSGDVKFEVIGLAAGDAALAQHRAEALKAQLVIDCGVSENTLVALARD